MHQQQSHKYIFTQGVILVLIVSCCLSVAIRVTPWLTAVFRMNADRGRLDRIHTTHGYLPALIRQGLVSRWGQQGGR
jgi:hypothetical protein